MTLPVCRTGQLCPCLRFLLPLAVVLQYRVHHLLSSTSDVKCSAHIFHLLFCCKRPNNAQSYSLCGTASSCRFCTTVGHAISAIENGTTCSISTCSAVTRHHSRSFPNACRCLAVLVCQLKIPAVSLRLWNHVHAATASTVLLKP